MFSELVKISKKICFIENCTIIALGISKNPPDVMQKLDFLTNYEFLPPQTS